MIKVVGQCIVPADSERGIVNVRRRYLSHEGLGMIETESIARESDFVNEKRYRTSLDNGKSFGDWMAAKEDSVSALFGKDEMLYCDTEKLWNPVHKHYVYTHGSRLFVDGHEAAYKRYWEEGKHSFFDHQYISVADEIEGAPVSTKMIKYEQGDDFSPEYPRNPEFLYKNGGPANKPTVLRCGDIIVPVSAHVDKICELYGLDTEEIFPNCPEIHRGLIIARGRYNEEEGNYDFTFSEPLLLTDLQSSRGIDEPIVSELRSGRLLLVMRGSNVRSANWRTRIKEGTPSYKWFSYSDDGGKTFSAPSPWIFDSGETVYSSATMSDFIRSSKNGKLYWIGNITDEHAYGNYPRYPLYIAEVDDGSGLLKKETLTVIDTRREREPDKVQLSNFGLIENRETLNFEVYLSKLAQFDGDRPFFGESWRYVITV